MPGRALVIGATGMVGRSWRGLLTAHGVEHAALARPECDLTHPGAIAERIDAGTALVVNAAAWTDVDGAEADEGGATLANGTAPGVLAERCRAVGATLIHYSTDYVFAGMSDRPYPVDAPINPVNAYGRSKAVGEQAVRDSGCDHLILRTSWVYAPWGKNFVRTIARLARDREEIRVVDDQRGRPTSAEALAASSLGMYLAGASGTWHATDAGECTWHGLASEVVRSLGLACRVTPCTTDEFPRPARRPAYSVLDLAQTEAVIGERTDWRTCVRRVLERMEA